MEQRKSDIDTGDANSVNVNANGLNYSFDFSSQVNNTVPGTVAPMPTAEPVAPAPMPAVEPVAPAPMPTVEPVAQAPMPTAEPVAPAPMPAVEPVQVQQATTQRTELIKDKNGTKKFLIIVGIIVVVFIIALPFIFKMLGWL